MKQFNIGARQARASKSDTTMKEIAKGVANRRKRHDVLGVKEFFVEKDE